MAPLFQFVQVVFFELVVRLAFEGLLGFAFWLVACLLSSANLGLGMVSVGIILIFLHFLKESP
jgi:hypothetical protein